MQFPIKHVVHDNVVDCSSMIGFPLEIADSECDMPGISLPGNYGLPPTISLLSILIHMHVVHDNVVDGSSMIRFPLVMADSEEDFLYRFR